MPFKVFARCFTRPPDNLGTPHPLQLARSNPIAPGANVSALALREIISAVVLVLKAAGADGILRAVRACIRALPAALADVFRGSGCPRVHVLSVGPSARDTKRVRTDRRPADHHVVGVQVGQSNTQSGQYKPLPQLETGRAPGRRNGCFWVGNGFFGAVERAVIGQIRDGVSVRKSLCDRGLGEFGWCSWSGVGTRSSGIFVFGGRKCAGDRFLGAHKFRRYGRGPASRERAEVSLRLAAA